MYHWVAWNLLLQDAATVLALENLFLTNEPKTVEWEKDNSPPLSQPTPGIENETQGLTNNSALHH